MSKPPVVARLRSKELARSPIRRIMELADRDNIVAMGLDPDDVISFAGGWVNHQAPEPMRAEYASTIGRLEHILAVHRPKLLLFSSPDTVHQAALVNYLAAALDDGSLASYLEDSRRLYGRAARHMSLCIEKYLRMPHLEPEGGLYTVVDVGTDAEAFVLEVLAATGVIFVPGVGFGDTLRNAVRVSFGPLVNDLERMEEGFARVRDYLDESRL